MQLMGVDTGFDSLSMVGEKIAIPQQRSCCHQYSIIRLKIPFHQILILVAQGLVFHPSANTYECM